MSLRFEEAMEKDESLIGSENSYWFQWLIDINLISLNGCEHLK